MLRSLLRRSEINQLTNQLINQSLNNSPPELSHHKPSISPLFSLYLPHRVNPLIPKTLHPAPKPTPKPNSNLYVLTSIAPLPPSIPYPYFTYTFSPLPKASVLIPVHLNNLSAPSQKNKTHKKQLYSKRELAATLLYW